MVVVLYKCQQYLKEGGARLDSSGEGGRHVGNFGVVCGHFVVIVFFLFFFVV